MNFNQIVCLSCRFVSVFNFVNPRFTTLIYLTKGLHYVCAFFSRLAFSSPSLAAHYEIRQCVLLQTCQRWGTPSPLAGPLFRFLISSLVFFFPSQPGTSCRGNDNTGGKQQRLITSPPTFSRSQPTRFISPSVRPKHVFFCTCGLLDLPPHFSIRASPRFICGVATLDP